MDTLFITLGVGIVCALVGAWAGHRLGLHQGRRDNRRQVINDVAERYHQIRQSGRSSGAHGLTQCGVYGLQNAGEIEQAVRRIQELGHSDPLNSNREDLRSKDIWHFFQVVRENRLNLIQQSDVNRAYELTRNT